MPEYTPLDMSKLKKTYGSDKTVSIVLVIMSLITLAVLALIALILLKKYQYI